MGFTADRTPITPIAQMGRFDDDATSDASYDSTCEWCYRGRPHGHPSSPQKVVRSLSKRGLIRYGRMSIADYIEKNDREQAEGNVDAGDLDKDGEGEGYAGDIEEDDATVIHNPEGVWDPEGFWGTRGAYDPQHEYDPEVAFPAAGFTDSEGAHHSTTDDDFPRQLRVQSRDITSHVMGVHKSSGVRGTAGSGLSVVHEADEMVSRNASPEVNEPVRSCSWHATCTILPPDIQEVLGQYCTTDPKGLQKARSMATLRSMGSENTLSS